MFYKFLDSVKKTIRAIIAAGGIRNGFAYRKIGKLLKKKKYTMAIE
jgi:hypothetical protein